MIDNTPLTAFDDWKGQPKQASLNITRILNWWKDRKKAAQPEPEPQPRPSYWPNQKFESLIAFYGEAREHLIYASLPYPHRLSWDKTITVTRFLCHERVKASLERILFRVLAAYGPEEIERLGLNLFGGCFNYRGKRNKPGHLSLHAWGIAVDYDPERNQMSWGKDKARFAAAEYEPWWQIWENEGWVSLGRALDYDWMHIQAAKL